MGAGKYSDRLQWLQRTLAKDTATGQDVETFPSVGYLWGSINLNSGRHQTDFGAEQSGADGEIRIRNFILSLAACDHLYAVEWAETWIVEDVRRGDNEMICTVHKFDHLTGVQ